MNIDLKYVPVFRSRQQELGLLKSFQFGENIYPYVEILKEFTSKPRNPENGKLNSRKRTKTFEFEYLEVVGAIKAKKIFIDIPVHFSLADKNLSIETISFLSKASVSHSARTTFIKQLTLFADRIVPVISSYKDITGENGTIPAQETDLRKIYKSLAFRCNSLNAFRDLPEFLKAASENDYIFLDWEETELDINDNDQKDIVELLKQFNCTIIVHRNPFPKELKNSGLKHGEVIKEIDNSLLGSYKEFGGSCMSDFVGIKKDFIEGGIGKISPGFIYYDAVNNEFYGYRFLNGGHKKGEVDPDIAEFETTIVPAVISSAATSRMMASNYKYLVPDNKGWATIKNIELGALNGGETGKQAAKFKRISMEHYLFCMKTKISNGIL